MDENHDKSEIPEEYQDVGDPAGPEKFDGEQFMRDISASIAKEVTIHPYTPTNEADRDDFAPKVDKIIENNPKTLVLTYLEFIRLNVSPQLTVAMYGLNTAIKRAEHALAEQNDEEMARCVTELAIYINNS